MVDNEDYFPRGGKKPTTKFFKQSANFLGAPEKADKKRKKIKKKSEEDDGYLTDEADKSTNQSYKNCGVWLKYNVVKEGLLLLGRVQQVQDTRVHVSLPCRLTGIVMACHVSEAYNKLLEAYVNDQIDTVKELKQMFRPGQYVALKVLEVASGHLVLSMMPQHVNSGKMQGKLHRGALFQAAVSSVEDHGYVMDIGIPNIRAFLPKNAANPEVDLDIGMLTWCSISVSPESSVVTLTSELPALRRAFQKKPSGALLPATSVNFTVDTPLENGIEGRIFEDKTAYIQRQHVDKVNGKKPALGQTIRARLLYTLPTTNIPFLTMRDIFQTTYPDMDQEQKIQEGDIINEAQVTKIVGRTVYMRLGEDSTGLLSLRRIQVHEDLQDEDVVAKSYPIGSTHRVRVLRYNMCDYTYAVTDERHVLNERYFSMAQLVAGQLLDAAVASVAHNHVVLRVGRFTGYVPHSHMTDSGVFVDPKKATNSQLSKKKFQVGQVLKARVLSVDPSRKRLFLTLKPTLLAPELELLTSYEDARVGKSYTGVIALIKDFLVVSFFNNVQAYVPRHFVSAEPLDSLADAFHLGQIVHCTIIQVEAEKKKISGSLTTAPFTPKDRKKPVKRKNPHNIEHSNTAPKSDNETSKKKKKPLEASEQNIKIEDTLEANKKKRKKLDDKQDDSKTCSKKSKIKEKKISTSTEVEKDVTGHDEVDEANSKRKKKKKQQEEITLDKSEENNIKMTRTSEKDPDIEDNITEIQPSTEESDAIETDYHEDSDHVLTPEDLGLIDMSDCQTVKQYKNRVVSLLKTIKARTNRIDTIDKKIMMFEDKGLTPQNKKYHTAMHMEKWVIEQRIIKLLAALQIAQDKLKEFGFEKNKDYKKKKDKQNIIKLSSDVEMENHEVNNNKNSKQITKKVIKKKSKVEETQLKNKLKDIKVVEELKPTIEVPSAKDFWSTDTEALTNAAQEQESSSSDDELETEKPKKKRKKLSAAEKVAKAREEEERVRELERRAVEGGAAPRSCDQFERALLASPAASQLWIAYMAFHLQATEVEKARGVARRALAAVPFREERERLNVWLALLNLEHRFGTKESQQKTLEEALQMNDPYEVHCKLLDILVDTGAAHELGALVELMARRYRRRAELYPRAGAACYRAGLLQRARQLMQKGLAALEKKEHVLLLVQFAQLERRAGQRDRAEALFERVLAVYPRRGDVCAQYVDMLAAAGDVQRVREVMERMTSVKLPARKMKILFKKWIEVEEKIGDSSHVESIRQRATEFIDNAKF